MTVTAGHVDFLIAGAGISGIGAAHHMRERFAGRSLIVLVPDGDFFTALREGKASIVTGTIDTFTETGPRVITGNQAGEAPGAAS